MSTDALFAVQRTLLVLLPEILLILTALVMITAGAFVRVPRRTWSIMSVVALLAALGVLIALRQTPTDAVAFGVVALNDVFSFYARLALLLTGLILFALSHDQVDDARAAEFFGALLLVHAGGMLVATANELVFLFAALELVSLPTYLLLYLSRRNPTTQEAATKYFYLSIFSAALLLFGLAYLYGMTGVSNLKALAYVLQATGEVEAIRPPLAFGLIALLFIMAGLGFRVAAVPFHFYAPDVYQGSPTAVAAMLAWIPKAIGFLAMLRVLTSALGAAGGELVDRAVMLAWILAVVTMTLGNTVALRQNDLKRLLAYSSIAHAGYVLIGVAVAFGDGPGSAAQTQAQGTHAILFYLAVYSLMTLGAFGVILALSTPERPAETIDQLAGLGRVQPLPALALALCLFSLAGVPPMAGFWGKFWVFAAALSAGGDPQQVRMFQWLAVIGVLNAAIGAYYYLRIVVAMYLRQPDPHAPAFATRAPWPTQAAVWTCALLSLFLGLLPAPIDRASRAAAVANVTRLDPTPATDAAAAGLVRIETSDRPAG